MKMKMKVYTAFASGRPRATNMANHGFLWCYRADGCVQKVYHDTRTRQASSLHRVS